MSQRDSGYQRKERDLYETPEWVTQALLRHLPRKPLLIWEPAAGSGRMSAVLEDCADTVATDIASGTDFLLQSRAAEEADAIITNPPYALATEFVEQAIRLTQSEGLVAMLLRTDFDHARTRENLFRLSPRFSKKVVLTKRIKWFEGSKGSPSFNHAWFIWDWQHQGPPTLAYGP